MTSFISDVHSPTDLYKLSRISQDTHETCEDRIYIIIVEGKNTIDRDKKAIQTLSHTLCQITWGAIDEAP